MMRGRTKSATLGVKMGAPALIPPSETPASPVSRKFSGLGIGENPHQPEVSEWEVRPGGMLVQKRDPDADGTAKPLPPPIRVRIKYGSVHHDIHISPQASFGINQFPIFCLTLLCNSIEPALEPKFNAGDLKKLLSAQLGLHPQDQKILFKNRERHSSAFLDTSGVKDRSKVVLLEDPAGQAKRFLEMRKNAKMEKAAKSISQISLEVDRLASQVSLLEAIICKGKKVAQNDVLRLIEQLMDLLIKLDGIIVEGDVKLQRGVQVERVQKYVEILDVLKIKNASPRDGDAQVSPMTPSPQPQHQTTYPRKQCQNHQQNNEATESPVATTTWETFDLLSSIPSTSSASSTTTAAVTANINSATSASTHIPRFDWELF